MPINRLAGLSLLAALLTGCGVATQVGIWVGLALAEPLVRRLENPKARCATDLVRRPDGSWWRCGQLESTAAELAEAAAEAEAAGYWP